MVTYGGSSICPKAVYKHKALALDRCFTMRARGFSKGKRRSSAHYFHRERHLFVGNGRGGLSCCQCLVEIVDASSYRIAERALLCKGKRYYGSA